MQQAPHAVQVPFAPIINLVPADGTRQRSLRALIIAPNRVLVHGPVAIRILKGPAAWPSVMV
jgi:hypothetical protein